MAINTADLTVRHYEAVTFDLTGGGTTERIKSLDNTTNSIMNVTKIYLSCGTGGARLFDGSGGTKITPKIIATDIQNGPVTMNLDLLPNHIEVGDGTALCISVGNGHCSGFVEYFWGAG